MASFTVITANYRSSGKARRKTWNGRAYLVADMTLIVPGVLEGSSGPLYYPEDEVRTSAPIWDMQPLVLGHPRVNNKFVSAKSPGVFDQFGLGYVRKPAYSNRLQAQGWFDEEYTKNKAPEVYARLERGEPVEISTGLETNNVPARNGSKDHKGRTYTHIARDYRADHVAVLPNAQGACSINDGCGVFNQRILQVSNGTVTKRPLAAAGVTRNSRLLWTAGDEPDTTLNCGGPGSGKPGPCPSAGGSGGFTGHYDRVGREKVVAGSKVTLSTDSASKLGDPSLAGKKVRLHGVRRFKKVYWTADKDNQIFDVSKATAIKQAHAAGTLDVVANEQEHVINVEGVCVNCGGPGSGRPGPCPGTGSSGAEKIEVREKTKDRLVADLGDKSRVEILTDLKPVATLENLETAKEYRGKGYAKELYRRVFAEMSRRGFTEVWSSENLQEGGQGVWESLKKDDPSIKYEGGVFKKKLQRTTANCGGPGSGRPGPCPGLGGSGGSGSFPDKIRDLYERAGKEHKTMKIEDIEAALEPIKKMGVADRKQLLAKMELRGFDRKSGAVVHAAIRQKILDRRSGAQRAAMIFDESGFDDNLSFNSFCPTGLGGGVDPTCKPGGSSGGVAASDPLSYTHFEPWGRSLTSKQKEAVSDYLSHSDPINNLLRDKDPLKWSSSKYQGVVRALDKATQSAPPLLAPATVFRGVPADKAKSLKVGEIIFDPAFVSTSKDRGTAAAFGDVVEVKLPKGAKGIYVDAVHHGGEMEYLLPRKSKFKVVPATDGGVALELVANRQTFRRAAGMDGDQQQDQGSRSEGERGLLRKLGDFITNLLGGGTNNAHESLEAKLAAIRQSFEEDHSRPRYDPYTGERLPDVPHCYLRAVYDDWIIYEEAGALYRQEYSFTDDVIDWADPVEVEVEYVPRGEGEPVANLLTNADPVPDDDDEDDEDSDVDDEQGHVINAEGVCANCGGPGSGVPGPCPSGGRKGGGGKAAMDLAISDLKSMGIKGKLNTALHTPSFDTKKLRHQLVEALQAKGWKKGDTQVKQYGEDTPMEKGVHKITVSDKSIFIRNSEKSSVETAVSNALVTNQQPDPTTPPENQTMKLTPEAKKEIVANLQANCSCGGADMPWKGQTVEALNAKSDDELYTMEQCRKAVLMSKNIPARNEASQPAVIDEAVINQIVDKVAAKVAPPKVEPPVPITANQMGSEEQEDLAIFRTFKQQQKAALIERLTANVSDPAKKAEKAKVLNEKRLAELIDLADLFPAAPAEPQASPQVVNFLGAAGTPPMPPVTQKPLPKVTYNWSEKAQKQPA